jgi:glutathione peroxidase
LSVWLAALPSLFLTVAAAEPANPNSSLFAFSAKLLDGTPQPLSAYKGKVVLVVNTATLCRYAPQFTGLEKLYQAYREQGFVILAFPSNDFRGKEPGSASEIGAFCRAHYGVSFPMFEKVNVIDPDASPLYKFLALRHGPPKWNFYKYLISKDGQVRAAFPSDMVPENPVIRGAIEAALKGP